MTVAPLGARADADGTDFAVFSSVAEAVDLCLFDADGNEIRRPLEADTGYVWRGRVDGLQAGSQYGFRVHGPWDPSHGARCNPAKLLLDPYARAIAGNVRWHPSVFGEDPDDSAPYVPRSVVSADGFDWRGDTPPGTALEDSIIYELHVKGFTKLHPDVPEELRGTYRGLAHPAVIDHLTKLGVTAVELLPVHQFVHDAAADLARAAQLLGLPVDRIFRPAQRVRVGRRRAAGRRVQADGPRAARRRARGDPRRRVQPHRRGQRARADAVLPGSGQRRLLPPAGRSQPLRRRHRLWQHGRRAPAPGTAADHGFSALLGAGHARRRLSFRPRREPGPRGERLRSVQRVPRGRRPGPGPGAGEADRRTMGHRLRRL